MWVSDQRVMRKFSQSALLINWSCFKSCTTQCKYVTVRLLWEILHRLIRSSLSYVFITTSCCFFEKNRLSDVLVYKCILMVTVIVRILDIILCMSCIENSFCHAETYHGDQIPYLLQSYSSETTNHQCPHKKLKKWQKYSRGFFLCLKEISY